MNTTEIKEEKTVDMLTKDSVSILTKKFIELDGEMNQVGENHRCAYENSIKGRETIQKNEPEYIVNSVFAIWGDEPTITYNIGNKQTQENEATNVASEQ